MPYCGVHCLWFAFVYFLIGLDTTPPPDQSDHGVKKNEINHWENLIGPFLVHKPLPPPPPRPPSSLLLLASPLLFMHSWV